MRRQFGVLTVLVLGGPMLAWGGDPLKVGDPAPPLKVARWIKGEPLATFEPGKTYVIDFWSTTVAESRAGIDHLNGLTSQYPDVRFVGVAVLEKDPRQVAPWVAKLGEAMSYGVALDKVTGGRPSNGAMVTTWLKAAGRTSIPATFVIRDTRIAWIGRPAELAGSLAAVIAGTYQPKPKPGAELEGGTPEAVRDRIDDAVDAHDYATVFRLVAAAVARDPGQAADLNDAQFVALCNTARTAEGLKLGESLLEARKFDAEGLNYLAWGVTDPSLTSPIDPQVAALARRAASRAVELDGTDPDYLDTLAATQYRTGDPAGAVASAQKALQNINRADPEDARELADSLRTNLKRYREAAQAAGGARPPASRPSSKKP